MKSTRHVPIILGMAMTAAARLARGVARKLLTVPSQSAISVDASTRATH